MLDFENLDQAQSEYQSARRLALNRLARRESTSIEILVYLQSCGVSEATADQVVEDLKLERMIQDERFLEIFIRAEGLKGKGALWISKKLAQKGIRKSPQEIKPLLENTLCLSEEEIILRLIDRRYPKAYEDPKEAQKAISGLIRRGFSYSKVQIVLGRVIVK